MIQSAEIYNQVYELIAEGQSEKACAAFMQAWQRRLVSYLRRYRWTSEEAIELIHDAYLMIEKKISNGELESFNITYIKRCCKNLGANRWRKEVRKKIEFLAYANNYRKEINDEFRNEFKLNLFEEEEEFSNEYRIALRAFDLMNERCREIIRLKHVDNLNHNDIVDKIASLSNMNSSKTILNRCMNTWKTLIQKIKSI